MTYQHKRDPCNKDAKEIVQSIFPPELETRELGESKHETERDNTFPPEVAALLNNRGESYAGKSPNTSESAALETYVPPNKVEFEATEAKETFEKKRKKRNYMEFSPEYSKEGTD